MSISIISLGDNYNAMYNKLTLTHETSYPLELKFSYDGDVPSFIDIYGSSTDNSNNLDRQLEHITSFTNDGTTYTVSIFNGLTTNTLLSRSGWIEGSHSMFVKVGTSILEILVGVPAATSTGGGSSSGGSTDSGSTDSGGTSGGGDEGGGDETPEEPTLKTPTLTLFAHDNITLDSNNKATIYKHEESGTNDTYVLKFLCQPTPLVVTISDSTAITYTSATALGGEQITIKGLKVAENVTINIKTAVNAEYDGQAEVTYTFNVIARLPEYLIWNPTSAVADADAFEEEFADYVADEYGGDRVISEETALVGTTIDYSKPSLIKVEFDDESIIVLYIPYDYDYVQGQWGEGTNDPYIIAYKGSTCYHLSLPTTSRPNGATTKNAVVNVTDADEEYEGTITLNITR